MHKYLKVYKVLLGNSFSFEAQYRQDTILKLIVNCLWLGVLILTVNILYNQTSEIVGWTKPQAYFLISLWAVVGEIGAIIYRNNLVTLSDLLISGDLDGFLLKPLKSLFLVSFRIFLVRGFYRLIVESILLIWIIWNFDIGVQPRRIPLALVMLLCAFVIDYSANLVMNSLSFWFLRIENINDAAYTIHTLGRYPIDVLPKTLRALSLSILTFAFIAYVPVATLIGRWPWHGIVYVICFAVFALLCAIKFWNYALRRYSSASS